MKLQEIPLRELFKMAKETGAAVGEKSQAAEVFQKEMVRRETMSFRKLDVELAGEHVYIVACDDGLDDFRFRFIQEALRRHIDEISILLRPK